MKEKTSKQLKSNLEKDEASIVPPEVGDWEAAVASAGDELQGPIAVGTAFPYSGSNAEEDALRPTVTGRSRAGWYPRRVGGFPVSESDRQGCMLEGAGEGCREKCFWKGRE